MTCFSVIVWPTLALAGIEDERVRLDFDRLAHSPGSKQHVDSLDLVDRERDRRVDRRLEPRQFPGDHIHADREQRNDEVTVGATDGLASEAGLLIRHGHFHAGHHGTAGVAHGPRDLARGRLGG